MSLRVQANVDVVTKLDHSKVVSNFRAPNQSVAREIPSRPAGEDRQEKTSMETVELAVKSINGAIEHINRGLRFSIHEDTQRVMVKVVDVLTEEVIKEIPPEDVLDTAARIREMIGLLIDEWA